MIWLEIYVFILCLRHLTCIIVSQQLTFGITYGPTLHLHTQKYNSPFNLKLDVDYVLIIPLTRPHPPSPEVLFGFYRPTKINLYNA